MYLDALESMMKNCLISDTSLDSKKLMDEIPVLANRIYTKFYIAGIFIQCCSSYYDGFLYQVPYGFYKISDLTAYQALVEIYGTEKAPEKFAYRQAMCKFLTVCDHSTVLLICIRTLVHCALTEDEFKNNELRVDTVKLLMNFRTTLDWLLARNGYLTLIEPACTFAYERYLNMKDCEISWNQRNCINVIEKK